MEAKILLWIQDNLRNPILTPIMKAASAIGNLGIFWIALTLLLLIAAAVTSRSNKTKGGNRNPYLMPGLTCLLAILICFIVGNITIKSLVGRIRPYDVIEGLTVLVRKPLDSSFPSGHSSISTTAAVALFLSVPKSKRPLAACGIALAALTAFSRLYVGVHYPTDVLGGILLGILCAFVAKRISGAILKKKANQ